MLLSARLIKDCYNVNSFEFDTELNWTEGDTLDMYLQLIDSSLDRPEQGFSPAGRRYVPAVGSSLTVLFENIDDLKKLSRVAVQPFPLDGSIWKVSILSTDPLRGTPQIRLALSESGVTTRGLLKNCIRIHPKDSF